MGFDPISAATGDLHDRLCHTAVLDVGGSTASGADDMVVVDGCAGDVRVLAARQVESFNHPQVSQ